MGRREWYREGRVPLHTSAAIGYGTATGRTTMGAAALGQWICWLREDAWTAKAPQLQLLRAPLACRARKRGGR